MTEKLKRYVTMKQDIDRARQWQKHLSATSRTGEGAVISSIGSNPSICIQYSTGGKNYWDAREEAGQTFLDCLNAVIGDNLWAFTEKAISKMECELGKSREAAKAEYQSLFGEDA